MMSSQFQEGQVYKIREFAKFLGILNAACPALAYSSTFCKRLERQKYLALVCNDNDYEGYITINKMMLDDLNWWRPNVIIGSNPIGTNQFLLEIYSDASLSGWGASCKGKCAQGFWSNNEKKFSINYLELLAAFSAKETFASHLNNCEILLRIDNTSAISYIYRAGGVQFPHLSELSRSIWEWCQKRNLWLFASYIASPENVEADAASRITNIDTEWEIKHRIFQQVNKKFGPFTLDAFASNLNKKCLRYCSRYPQPDTFAVDAFTIPWQNEKIYSFPPFSLILRIINKIMIDKAEVTLIAPYWPTQPWFPLFQALLKTPPLFFKPDNKNLLSPCRTKTHPLAAKLSLLAGRLSGNIMNSEASMMKHP